MPRESNKVLTNAQVRDYKQQGFVSPIDVMSETDAMAYKQRLENAERDYPEHINAENRNNAHLVFSFLDELAFNPIILGAVEDIIGPDFSLWGTVLFIKEPGTQHYVSWHQDATYMGMSHNNFVTPWIALSESNRETGCMSMVPGSHKQHIRPHEDTFAEDNILTRGQVVKDVDETTAVDLIMRPGQMSLHHGEVVHGSQPNLSKERRIGFALQSFMTHDTQQLIGENRWLHSHGSPRNDAATQFINRPTGDVQPEAVTLRAAVNRNFSDILYHGARKVRNY